VGKGEGAEFVAFFFGVDAGGPVEANIQRWQSQFVPVDGKPVEPKVGRYKIGKELKLTTVSLTGTYARGVGVGPVGTPKPDQTLLCGVYETPKGTVTFQLHGPRKTIDANRDLFSDVLLGLR
jgi:hypothetical protein